MKRLFVVLMIVFSGGVFGQQSQRVFLEPSVSLAYDTGAVKNLRRFSGYQSAEYLYQYVPGNSMIDIRTGHSDFKPSHHYQDSICRETAAMCRKADDDTMKVYSEPLIFQYKDFYGVGLMVKSKKEKKYLAVFYSTCYYEGGYCTIFYSGTEFTPIKKYDKHYSIFKSVIDSITIYAGKNFAADDSLLRLSFIITVDSVWKTSTLPEQFIPAYYGKLNIRGGPVNSIRSACVILGLSKQIFYPDLNGDIIVTSDDKQKGWIDKKGELNVIDRYGREVSIPFSFRYYNK